MVRGRQVLPAKIRGLRSESGRRRVWSVCPGEGHSGSGGIMGNERQRWKGQVLKGLDYLVWALPHWRWQPTEVSLKLWAKFNKGLLTNLWGESKSKHKWECRSLAGNSGCLRPGGVRGWSSYHKLETEKAVSGLPDRNWAEAEGTLEDFASWGEGRWQICSLHSILPPPGILLPTGWPYPAVRGHDMPETQSLLRPLYRVGLGSVGRGYLEEWK